MEQNEKKINPELDYLLRSYRDYLESENPRSLSYYLKGLSGLMDDLDPYLKQTFVKEKTQAFEFDYDNIIPEWIVEPTLCLAQTLDLKLIKIRLMGVDELNPLETYIVLGNKTHYRVFMLLWLSLLKTYECSIAHKRKLIISYNQKLRYHKNKSPHKIKYKPLDAVNLIASKKRQIILNTYITFNRLVKNKHQRDAPWFVSKSYKRFKKEINLKIVEIIGPRWKDRLRDTKSVKYYFGKKLYKCQNRWLSHKTLPGYLKRIKELSTALENLKVIKIPKDLPPMPKHSRKVKGALRRWLPKPYR